MYIFRREIGRFFFFHSFSQTFCRNLHAAGTIKKLSTILSRRYDSSTSFCSSLSLVLFQSFSFVFNFSKRSFISVLRKILPKTCIFATNCSLIFAVTFSSNEKKANRLITAVHDSWNFLEHMSVNFYLMKLEKSIILTKFHHSFVRSGLLAGHVSFHAVSLLKDFILVLCPCTGNFIRRQRLFCNDVCACVSSIDNEFCVD